MKSKIKYCSNYTGLACIDGSCPIARREEYSEYEIEVPINCDECLYNKGCEDCAWFGSEICGAGEK